MRSKIGHNIRSIRLRKGISQTELADALHVDQRTISAYERGVRSLDAYQVLLISRVLNCSVYALYEGLLLPEGQRLNEFAYLCNEDMDIIRYVASVWNGDVHALVQALCMYASVPKALRADIAGMCIHQYDIARDTGTLDPDAPPVDVSYIEHAWERIATRKDNKV